mmetsp:Transcript_15672/g.24832  ORF Transcript_15672/g.24832 Transcript_15672/m.24832 type:complete len:120 (+) Transcript_15672:519-878(+)
MSLNHTVLLQCFCCLLITACNSKAFFNGYAHIPMNNDNGFNEENVATPVYKYNHFLHGEIYELTILSAMMYFSMFVCIGMCLGGFIKYLESKCNESAEYQHIQTKNLNRDVKIKVHYVG